MDAVDISKIIGAKVGGLLDSLFNELVPELSLLFEKLPEFEAFSGEGERQMRARFIAARSLTVWITASMLDILRVAGCPENVFEEIVQEAVAKAKAKAQQERS